MEKGGWSVMTVVDRNASPHPSVTDSVRGRDVVPCASAAVLMRCGELSPRSSPPPMRVFWCQHGPRVGAEGRDSKTVADPVFHVEHAPGEAAREESRFTGIYAAGESA